VSGAVCFWACTELKQKLRYDDSLDAFGVHGIAGMIGMLATGWFAYGPLTATKEAPNGVYVGGLELLGIQVIAILATIVFVGIMSFILLKLTDLLVGLRVSTDEEREGLDIVLHGEQVF
jgi:Amt family ammonium transporter